MITLEKVIGEIDPIISKHQSQLEKKYLKVELTKSKTGLFLTCQIDSKKKITLQVVADFKRRTNKPPQSGQEHQKNGGHKALIEQFNRTNPEAWEIEVKQTIENHDMEIFFGGNESNWDKNDFEKKFYSYFFKQNITKMC